MGGCIQTDKAAKRPLSSKAAHQPSETNQDIGRYLENQFLNDKKIKKIILLGSGSSGKSTLFGQLLQIYKKGLDTNDYATSKFVIRSNCIVCIIALLKRMQKFWEAKHEESVYIDLSGNQYAVEQIQRVLYYASSSEILQKYVADLNQQTANILTEAITYLWSLPQVRKAYGLRQYYAFAENMDYYFEKVKDIFSLDYETTLEDVLKCRPRTVGWVEEHFAIQSVPCTIFDAGGQRTERRKWIELFDGVSVVIFVAALNHFCTVLFEDESKNSMEESLELFDEICNQRWLRNTQTVLLLNKDDLFKQRLREGLSLSICFGEEWLGPDYVPKGNDWQGSSAQDEAEFEKCYQMAVDFVRRQYVNLNKDPFKKVHVHVTTATDMKSTTNVFDTILCTLLHGQSKVRKTEGMF